PGRELLRGPAVDARYVGGAPEHREAERLELLPSGLRQLEARLGHGAPQERDGATALGVLEVGLAQRRFPAAFVDLDRRAQEGTRLGALTHPDPGSGDADVGIGQLRRRGGPGVAPEELAVVLGHPRPGLV